MQRIPAVSLLCGALVLAGCSKGNKPDPAVAEVNGHTITLAEVDEALGHSLSQIEQQIYAMRRQQIEALVAQKLLETEAKSQNLTIEQLLQKEADATVTRVSEADVEAFCAARPGQCGEGDDGRARRAALRDRLQEQRVATLRNNYVQRLRAQATVTVTLEEPEPFRSQVGEGTLPPRGASDAQVTIVEFSDYHCPFCKRVQPTLQRLLEMYPNQVRLVYRDNPIDQLHPEARRVSEAARCANDQGRFWEFHDALYNGPSSAHPDVLRAAANAAGVDFARLEACLAAGTHRAAVQADIDEAARLGADATPAFFVNGVSVRGAQPLEGFTRIIDRELERSGASRGR